MLKFNSEHMYGLKFLNVIHDGWRNKNGDSIIGVSLAFIDNQWKFRHIAVLATVMPEGHEACEVAKMIKERSVKIYGVDFIEMMKWMMSDTANSARAVANYFPDADQEDCSMHLMNLCISYGLGLRENYKTKKEKNGRSVRSVVTPGGPFPQGKEVIRKLRALNNYFNSGNRANALRAVQQALSYPELTSYLDVDTRVASSCKLIRRSILNYNAMAVHFRSEPEPNLFSVISADEWKLAIEMEAITNFMSDIALIEYQRESILSSYTIVFRRMVESELNSDEFECLTLKFPQHDASDDNQAREIRKKADLGQHSQTCLMRCKLQVPVRFPVPTEKMLISLLLDPRTKNKAASIVEGTSGASLVNDKQMTDLMESARAQLFKVHVDVYRKMRPCTMPRELSPEQSPILEHQSPVLPRKASRACLFGAPAPSSSKYRARDSHIEEGAEVVMKNWINLDVRWEDVVWGQMSFEEKKRYLKRALGQKEKTVENQRDTVKTVESVIKRELTIVDDDGNRVWNLLELYRRVDILRWFREEGVRDFPSVAVVARQYLGRVTSSAFQERVFSTAGLIMGSLRTRTDDLRAEKQLLLRHNRDLLCETNV